MEHDVLDSIAQQVVEAMAQVSWSGQGLDEIEGAVQQMVQQVANQVLEEHILPRRIQEIQAQVEAGELGCQECPSRYQIHQRDQVIHLKTIFGGEIRVSRHQYVCRRCDRYVMVADQELGLIGHRMTPRLAVVVALCGASWSYEVAAAFLHFLWGVSLSAKTVQNVSTDERLQPTPLPEDPLDQPPGVVTMDGVVIRGRDKDQWLEMKVGSFFSHVARVSQDRREVLDASFVAGAMQRWDDFVDPVFAEARRRGLRLEDPVEFVSDGAEGIWQLQQFVFPRARPRLDQYHTKCKISERTGQAFAGHRAKTAYQQTLQDWIEQGQIDQAIEFLQRHLPGHEKKKKAARKLINYLKRHRARLPDYQQVKADGGTVSSGLMEKANDLIVVRRLKQGIMHWTRDGADPVIQQRTAFINKHAPDRTGPYDLAFCHQ